MAETIAKKKRIVKQKVAAMDDLRAWLMTLHPAIKPTVHVNGKDYPACVVTVDFGVPLEPLELTAEQATELPKKLKALTKEILHPKEIQDSEIRIWNDTANGVWWTGTKHWA
jgi:predicted glycosyltransferase